MELAEIYSAGKNAILSKKIGVFLGGVETEFVLANNRRIMERYTFRQRAIDGIAKPDTNVEILGITLGTPVIMSAITAPIPAITPDGLMDVARGLKAAGSLMWTGSPLPANLKELKMTGVPLAANAKPYTDRKKMFKALEDIQKADVDWVGIEIDSGRGTKIRDREMVSDCAPLSFSELKDIRKAVVKPLIFKGVLSGDDAAKAVEAGADGILVSNHGAHTLDYLPHPFQVMDEIMTRAGSNVVVMMDGGFRRGSDVLKGLALGASAVGLGRPILYGLAADGQNGVRDVVAGITRELERMVSMVGAPDVRHIAKDILIQS